MSNKETQKAIARMHSPAALKRVGRAFDEFNARIAVQRQALARRVAESYKETQSLRATAEKIGLSHETVRRLLRESRDTTE